MGKVTVIGSLPPDHPIYSGGPEVFSHRAFSRSSTSSAPNTDGGTQAKSSSVAESVDELEDGRYRMAKFKHQNAQFARSKVPRE
jgi:hypothetical protein